MTSEAGKIWSPTDPEENYPKYYYIDFAERTVVEGRYPADFQREKVAHLTVGDKKWVKWRKRSTRLLQIIEITDERIVFDWKPLEEKVDEMPPSESKLLSIIAELVNEAHKDGIISVPMLDKWEVPEHENQAFTEWLIKNASVPTQQTGNSNYNVIQNNCSSLLATMSKELDGIIQSATDLTKV